MRDSTLRIVMQRAGVGAGLAVLAGLVLFPLLAKCRCAEGATLSRGNLKQLTFALIQYTQDYDGRLPGWVRNPDGQFAHNVWDEQIDPHILSKAVFRMPEDGPGIRSYSDPRRERVLTYGLNAVLIGGRLPFDGHADLGKSPRRIMTVQSVADASRTIVFAEISTWRSMPAPYGLAPQPIPFTSSGSGKAIDPVWKHARDGWIDISPREFVENTLPPDCYEPGHWDPRSGISRAAYHNPGAPYGFLDGHVEFLTPAETVTNSAAPVRRDWSPGNLANMWNPDR